MEEVAPVLLIGAGRMGQALISGWRRSGALPFARLMIRTPSPKPEADAAAAQGAILNPPDEALAGVRTVVFCVKPQKRREVAALYEALLPKDAVVLSVLVGVRAAAVSSDFGGRRVARVLPTTGVARAAGVTAVHAPDPEARARAQALFAPVSTLVDLEDEALMDAAGAVSASGAAYVYAFAQALERAGLAAGLPPEPAAVLARATLATAAAHLAESGADPQTLIDQVASPGGTTRAALAVLQAEAGLDPLLRDAVAAAVRRAQELAG
ncbi:MAG TPA: pyrroline-5-carboxylate reductase dimerization domain-containing protein [Caulobacteraceae bacterium]|nr:pyrroline-5-carboxylate reductase dimerization domain-containing protein [Caulobacteraceae bacterium]